VQKAHLHHHRLIDPEDGFRVATGPATFMGALRIADVEQAEVLCALCKATFASWRRFAEQTTAQGDPV
jgi:hypothetical protein